MGLKSLYKKIFNKKTRPIDNHNRVKILFHHEVDKDVQSMLFPLNLMQFINFSSKYLIKHDFITPNKAKTIFVSVFWTILRIIPFASRSITKMTMGLWKADIFMLCLAFVDIFFYSFCFIVVNIFNIVHAKFDIATVLVIQEFHRLFNNTRTIKSITKWNWIAVILISSFHLVIAIVNSAHGSPWFMIICNIFLFCFDANMVYAIRLISSLEDNVISCINEVVEPHNYYENKRDFKFVAYNKILECYNLFKITYQPLVSYF